MVGTIADAVTVPTHQRLVAMADAARQLRAASFRADADLVTLTARQAPVAGDLRCVLCLIGVAQHVGLIANQFDLINQQLETIDADMLDRQGTGEMLSEMASL